VAVEFFSNIYLETTQMKQNEINVLSLFDGISVAQLALSGVGITVKNYYASEIDENAIRCTHHHFPNTIQLGDVRNVDTTKLPPIDIMVWGSPCQDMSSINKNRKGLAGEKSSLFHEAVRILNEVKQKNPRVYFLMENVASMSDDDRDVISEILGVKPIKINSEEYSPAKRNRYYWTNIPRSNCIPKKNYTILKYYLESGYTERVRANCITTRPISLTKKGLMRYLNKSFGQVVWTDEEFCKLPFIKKIEMIENEEVKPSEIARLMTKVELCRMQELPADYCDILTYNHAHHAIGNAFTLPVIKYLLSFAKSN
jgi:site-specific DNA-cytosine methylase